MKKILSLVAVMLLLVSHQAYALMISSTVQGSLSDIMTFEVNVNPSNGQQVAPIPSLNYLTYGDFTMDFANDFGATTSTVGDGVNDQTWWAFDFTGDAQYAAFNASSEQISSALLTMTLSPTEQFYFGDSFYIPGLNGSYDVDGDQIVQTTNDNYVIVQLELIGGAHNTEDIWNKYMGSGTFGPNNSPYSMGILPAKYFDDALIINAKLDLTKGNPVPEPATMVLMGIGLTGMALKRRKA